MPKPLPWKLVPGRCGCPHCNALRAEGGDVGWEIVDGDGETVTSFGVHCDDDQAPDKETMEQIVHAVNGTGETDA